jgi:hypothetical protein
MVLYAYMCCVCVFSLRRESSDMILGDKPLISEVVSSQQDKEAIAVALGGEPHEASHTLPFSFEQGKPRCI